MILGTNGSGKSTMMRIIVGITKPTEGEMRLAGQDITALTGRELANARMVLGMVPACKSRETPQCDCQRGL